MGLLAGLALGGVLYAQSENSPSQGSGSSGTLATFIREQRELARARQSLVAQGATRQQLQAWQQQNAGAFQALQQMAQSLAATSALQPAPANHQANIPPNASPTLRDFLTTRAALANARAQIHNQLLAALPSGATQEQIQAMRQQAQQMFRQQCAGDLQLQAQRVQILGAASASQPVPVPGPAVIPPNASPQLRAFLTARNTLATERAQLWNQYLNAAPAARQAAIEQWRQQNAARFQQLSQLAKDLSTPTATQEGQTQ